MTIVRPVRGNFDHFHLLLFFCDCSSNSDNQRCNIVSQWTDWKALSGLKRLLALSYGSKTRYKIVIGIGTLIYISPKFVIETFFNVYRSPILLYLIFHISDQICIGVYYCILYSLTALKVWATFPTSLTIDERLKCIKNYWYMPT